MTIKEYTLYDAGEILPLYKSVGWTNYVRSPDMLEKAYRRSLLVLAAYEGESLAGVIRVVGDGCSIIFVQDVLVLPEYQRRGIGTALVRAVLERYSHVYQMELATDNTEKTSAFYRSLGFKPLEELGCRGFIKMNF